MLYNGRATSSDSRCQGAASLCGNIITVIAGSANYPFLPAIGSCQYAQKLPRKYITGLARLGKRKFSFDKPNLIAYTFPPCLPPTLDTPHCLIHITQILSATFAVALIKFMLT